MKSTWDFNTSGDVEGWYAKNQISAGPTQSSGQMHYTVASGATDPMIASPQMEYPITQGSWLKVRAQNETAATSSIMFWDNSAVKDFTTGYQASYSINPNDTQISEYWVNMANSSNWGGGYIQHFRFDFPDGPNGAMSGDVSVDQIQISASGPPSPAASAITQHSPVSSAWLDIAQVIWEVRFNHSMSTVAANDFAFTAASGTVAGSVASVTRIGPTWYRVTANVSGSGPLRLDCVTGGSARDVANQAISSAYSSGEVYLVDREAPGVPDAPTDSGAYSTTSTLVFNWLAVTDSGAGLSGYHCQIGTSPGASDVFNGTVGNTLTKSISGVDGLTYYCRVSSLDVLGNQSSWSASSNGITVDMTPSTPVIGGSSGITNTRRQLTVDFGETVAGFILTDLQVSNGTASNLNNQGTGQYTFDVDGTAGSEVTVSVLIAAGALVDAAGNPNLASNTFSYSFDALRPTPSISGSLALTNGLRTLTVDFLEEVDGFVEGDILVTNGTALNLLGGPQVYTFDVLGAATGVVSVQLPEGAAQDPALNDSEGSNIFSFDFDNTRPAPILSGDADLTNGPRTFSVDFGEVVTGFEIGEVAVTNGTASDFASSDDIVFTFVVTGTARGSVEVRVPADVAQDAAMNGNQASNPITYSFDNEGPTPSISGDLTTTNTTRSLTITFNEPVTNFELTDIAVTNGTASNFEGSDALYTVDIDGAVHGTVSVSIAAGAALDAAGNQSEASNSVSYEYDVTRPTTTLSGSYALTGSTREITITFSEAVTGLSLADISVTNGTASNLEGADTTYTVDVDGAGQATVTVWVGQNAAYDVAGNGSRASNSFQYPFDAQPPTPVISGESSLTNAARALTIAFGEYVKNFTLGDVVVVNGAASSLQNLGGNTYSVVITGSGEATVDVSIPAGSLFDNANNPNNASNIFSFPFDDVRPAPVISGETALTNGARTLTIDFGEAVTGFDLSMLSVSNASASNLQDLGGGQYRVDLSASGDVNVTVSMAADQVSDAAGNLNTASNTFSYAYDDVAPAPVISGETALTNVVRTVTIDFGEAVSGFDLGGLILSNGTMNNLQDLGGGRYSVDLRGTGESTVYLYVDAGVAQDAATNLNTQSNTFSFAYDDIAPTPVIEGESTPTRTTRTLTLRFSEAVVGFGPEHISVRNGTASNFHRSRRPFLEHRGARRRGSAG